MLGATVGADGGWTAGVGATVGDDGAWMADVGVTVGVDGAWMAGVGDTLGVDGAWTAGTSMRGWGWRLVLRQVETVTCTGVMMRGPALRGVMIGLRDSLRGGAVFTKGAGVDVGVGVGVVVGMRTGVGVGVRDSSGVVVVVSVGVVVAAIFIIEGTMKL